MYIVLWKKNHFDFIFFPLSTPPFPNPAWVDGNVIMERAPTGNWRLLFLDSGFVWSEQLQCYLLMFSSQRVQYIWRRYSSASPLWEPKVLPQIHWFLGNRTLLTRNPPPPPDCLDNFGPNIAHYFLFKSEPFACWDCGFESRRGHRCLSLVNVVCRHVEVSATGRSLVQRKPTECGVSVTSKPQQRGSVGPSRSVAPQGKYFNWNH